MVGYLPRLVDKEDVIGRFAVAGCAQRGKLPFFLAEGSELVTRGDDDAAVWRDRGGGRGDCDLLPYIVRDVLQALFGDKEADRFLPEALPERPRETVSLPVGEGDDGDPRGGGMRHRLLDQPPQGVGLSGARGGFQEDPLDLGGAGERVAKDALGVIHDGSVGRSCAGVVGAVGLRRPGWAELDGRGHSRSSLVTFSGGCSAGSESGSPTGTPFASTSN